MSPEEITTFFVSQGLRVVKTASCSWYNEYGQHRIYHSFPIHRLVTPGQNEIKEVFSSVPKAVALRFIGPVRSKGQNSFIWVCRNPYELENLSSNTRSHVRRGLKKCHVRSMSFAELVSLGWEAHRDTAQRHREDEPSSLGIEAKLDNCAAYEAWGGFVDGHLAAYIVTQWVEDWVHILLNRSVNAYLKFYPNNALIFSVVREMLSRPGVQAVSYGFEPLTAADSLERFKSAMGFVKEPVSQRVVLAPRMKLLVNPITSRSVEALASLLPGVPRLQKIAGLCRLARNG
jgi:hypothetical protein